jgi:hypothetical protein
VSDTVAMTLTEFLLARIAEDGAVARRGMSEPAYLHWGDSAWEETYKMGEGEGCSEEGAAFIEHMSPARVLAECEAKRRIVAQFQPSRNGYSDLLALLALPYADHPDYNPEWRP